MVIELFGNIIMWQPFRYWCQKVLPAVYDDSLSYYELICKCIHYLNELGEMYNELVKKLEELKEYIDNTLGDEIEDYVDQYINELIENGYFDQFFISDTVYIDHMGVLPHNFTVPGITEYDETNGYPNSMFKIMQGGCMIGPEEALVAFNTGQDGDHMIVLRKIDITDGTSYDYAKVDLGHCNSLTLDRKNNLVWQGGYLIYSENRNRVTCFNPGLPIDANNFKEYWLDGLEALGIPQRLQSFTYSHTNDRYYAMTANSIRSPRDAENGNCFMIARYRFENDEFVLEKTQVFDRNMGHNTACAFAWHQYYCVVYEQPGTIYVFNNDLELVKTIKVDKHVQGIRMANEIENIMSWDEDNLYVGYLLSGTHTQNFEYKVGTTIEQTRLAENNDVAFGKITMTNKAILSSSGALPSVAYYDYVQISIDPSNTNYDRDGSAANPFQSFNELCNVLTNENINSIIAYLLDDITDDFKPISTGGSKLYINGNGHTVTGGLVCMNVRDMTFTNITFTGIQADLNMGECVWNGRTHHFQASTGIICELPTGQNPIMYATAYSDVRLQFHTQSESIQELAFTKLYANNSNLEFPENCVVNLCQLATDNVNTWIEPNPDVTIDSCSLKNYKQRFFEIGYRTDGHNAGGNITKPFTIELPVFTPLLLVYNMTIPTSESVLDPAEENITVDGSIVLGRTVLPDARNSDFSATRRLYVERLYTESMTSTGNTRKFGIALDAFDYTDNLTYYETIVNSIFLESV